MTPAGIILSRADAQSIRALATRAFPEECCGLLIGAGEDLVAVRQVVPTANTAADKQAHFAIDPQVQFERLRAARDRSQRIVGHYHSHPNGRATPSAEDLDMAHDPGAVWLIVPVADGSAGVIRAFVRPESAGFLEIPLRTG